MRLYVGMRGPVATFALRFPDFGVDVAAAARALTMTVSGANGFVVADPAWLWDLLDTPTPRATWIPTGSEFHAPGRCLFAPELTLDGQHYDVLAFTENVWPRIAA